MAIVLVVREWADNISEDSTWPKFILAKHLTLCVDGVEFMCAWKHGRIIVTSVKSPFGTR